MKINVVKVGGKVVESPASLALLLDSFAAMPGLKVLVHGGGRKSTSVAERLGVETVMIDGRRVTDEAMLEVVTMVYGGLVNKRIVAGMQARGVNAVGLTGADMNAITSRRRSPEPVDYGWVGDVERVDAAALTMLLSAGIVPVMAPLTHDGRGNILNTNADTIASQVARALAAAGCEVTLTFCFEFPGVLADASDPSSTIPEINRDSYAALKEAGVVSGGMIPKLDNAFDAIASGVKRVVIKSAEALADPSAGTTID